MSNLIDNLGIEAIIGLAYPEFAEKGVTPLFDNMMAQKVLKSNMFAFFVVNEK
jgi:hypothetical protein